MLHKTLWSLCLLLTFPRLAVCWPKLCFSFILSKCHPEAKKSQSSWIKESSLPLYWVCGLFKGFLVFQKDPCVVFSLICGAWHPMLDEKQLPRISLYTQLTSLLRIIRRKEQRSYSSSFLFVLQLAAILQNHSVLIPCWWTFQSRDWILTQHKLMEKEHFLDLDAFTFFAVSIYRKSWPCKQNIAQRPILASHNTSSVDVLRRAGYYSRMACV